jgi:hypothetical protein
MSRCPGRPNGRPEGTEAKRRPLTTTGTPTRHNKNRPPARAGLQANRPHEVRLNRFGVLVLRLLPGILAGAPRPKRTGYLGGPGNPPGS